MVIYFVIFNLPTVLLMFFNKLVVVLSLILIYIYLLIVDGLALAVLADIFV